MFSTALAKASAAVPKSHPALDRLTATSRRARASRARWKGDGAVDIGCIVRAAGFFDVATNRVELGAHGAISVSGQMGGPRCWNLSFSSGLDVVTGDEQFETCGVPPDKKTPARSAETLRAHPWGHGVD
jgi:hypothetical protein